MRKIVTTHVYPPIPVRTSDWCAHYDGEEEAGNYGWGATEEEAIADFIENCAEDHDERLGERNAEAAAWVESVVSLASGDAINNAMATEHKEGRVGTTEIAA